MLAAERDGVVAREAVGVHAQLAHAQPERIARRQAADPDRDLLEEMIETPSAQEPLPHQEGGGRRRAWQFRIRTGDWRSDVEADRAHQLEGVAARHDAGPQAVVEVHPAVLELILEVHVRGARREVVGDLREREVVGGDEPDRAARDERRAPPPRRRCGGRASWCRAGSRRAGRAPGACRSVRSTTCAQAPDLGVEVRVALLQRVVDAERRADRERRQRETRARAPARRPAPARR